MRPLEIGRSQSEKNSLATESVSDFSGTKKSQKVKGKERRLFQEASHGIVGSAIKRFYLSKLRKDFNVRFGAMKCGSIRRAATTFVALCRFRRRSAVHRQRCPLGYRHRQTFGEVRCFQVESVARWKVRRQTDLQVQSLFREPRSA